MLDVDDFRRVVRDAPLVAIDLLVGDGNGHYLLGLRRNRPAAGFWFVPGGRVYKDEALDAAFARIARAELGLELSRSGATAMGVSEHFYPDSFADVTIGTHYVVLPYRVTVSREAIPVRAGEKQHCALEWMSSMQLRTRTDVHAHTRAYFIADE
ncbi:GDP-mannose mannosyl hydrolase [Paludibacterium yongneupense]|uniref:GDP-mannose mannosyl hydrolase n=1 Tax=Paludibacterium yongneupense TaxID=400061 RepID=UPI00041262BB|nr:GDP-mannose mannosyl hydrolase [Paludibacterium yongneupense]